MNRNYWPTKEWKSVNPSEVHMDSDKLANLDSIIKAEYKNLAGIVIARNGYIAFENYYDDYCPDNTCHVASVTKSFLSALVGIALDKGLIKSIDQKVLDFFSDYTIKRGEKTIQSVTIKNMLTMTAPYKYTFAPYIKYFTSDDGVKFTLDLLGGRGQIGKFRYTPLIGPDILSGILVKATGQSIFDFATENLFSPLGITVESNVVLHDKEEHFAFLKDKNISGWVVDLQGINAAGWGLTLTPRDMARFGFLYLNGGRWENKQVVSKKWIDESTKEHSRWDKLNLPYGYLWWIDKDGFAAMGDGGNVIYCMPEKDMVIAIASKPDMKAKDRMTLIKNFILPAITD